MLKSFEMRYNFVIFKPTKFKCQNIQVNSNHHFHCCRGRNRRRFTGHIVAATVGDHFTRAHWQPAAHAIGPGSSANTAYRSRLNVSAPSRQETSRSAINGNLCSSQAGPRARPPRSPFQHWHRLWGRVSWNRAPLNPQRHGTLTTNRPQKSLWRT